jgi:hypothetical protein
LGSELFSLGGWQHQVALVFCYKDVISSVLSRIQVDCKATLKRMIRAKTDTKWRPCFSCLLLIPGPKKESVLFSKSSLSVSYSYAFHGFSYQLQSEIIKGRIPEQTVLSFKLYFILSSVMKSAILLHPTQDEKS